ncbi:MULTISPECIES: hypothetical protein [Noviherbaspirillum]|uniref:hypothetical protein n=1 Tax=Noviherbaspirillum TaxID=1344552 RepID=UPI00178C1AF1|nr:MULTISPECIES: hypothetical protein [Noviherbaspirillum]
MEKPKKTYGVKVVPKKTVQRAIQVSLANKEGSRVIRSAVRRVLVTHADVIKALAKR